MATKNTFRRLEAEIEGRVIGVFFRAYVEQRANQLGLVGAVRNSAHGTVKVIAEGAEPKLRQLLKTLWQGPSGAVVGDVRERWLPAQGNFDRFIIVG